MKSSDQVRRKIGAGLREAREKAGLTQQQVAAILGCGRIRWSRIERGSTTPDWDEMLELSQLLRAQVNELFGGVARRPRTWRTSAQSRESRRWLGQKLRVMREANGLSQAELGRHLGCSFNRIYLVERGTNALDAAETVELCKLFQIRPMDLYSGAEDWPEQLRRKAQLQLERQVDEDQFV